MLILIPGTNAVFSSNSPPPKTPGNYIREAYFHSFKSKRAGGENKVDDDKRMHSDKNIRGQMR